jgi:hypothetical protein
MAATDRFAIDGCPAFAVPSIVYGRFCIGQPQRGQVHAPSRRFLMPGKHRAPNLREDGLFKLSLTTTVYGRFGGPCQMR